MADREKLIEAVNSFNFPIESGGCTIGAYIVPYSIQEPLVDHLIANAVTIQKWIPLSEQKPDRDTLVIVFFEGMRDTPAAIQIMYGWCIGGSATHWMPLPEPPKGE